MSISRGEGSGLYLLAHGRNRYRAGYKHPVQCASLIDTLHFTLRELAKDGFQVMVYTSDDPIVAKQLEEIGCVAVMPLASLIGSGMGILNPWNLQIIMEHAQAPVIVDAGGVIGT